MNKVSKCDEHSSDLTHYGNFIGNEFVKPESGEYLTTENPFTNKGWALIPRSGAKDIDKAVTAASTAFTEGPWGKSTAVERATLLRKLGDLVLENVENLAVAEVRDNGKTITEMHGQVKNIAEWYYFYAGLADKIVGEVLPTERAGHMNYTRLEPLGVIGMITPWNSPLRLLAWKLAPALAAGNTVVIKPSEFTSTSTLEFVALIKEAGFPVGVVNVVTGLGGEAGSAMSAHSGFAKFAFTGGSVGGGMVYAAAAKLMKPVTLELGGKSPNIVFEDADFEMAARGVVTGIFASAGQSCVAGSRLLIHRSLHDRMVKRITELVQDMRMGDPMDPKNHVGPVATRPQYERILGFIEMAKSEGAQVACGGGAASGEELGDGLFVQPTVFVGVNNDMRIAQEEVFGPVLAVIPFDDDEEAIRLANDIAFGLGAGIWTQNLTRAHTVAALVQAGSVWINTYRISSQISPFGGFKDSGIGREGGTQMIKNYLQTKSVWINLTGEFPYPFK